MAAAVLLSESPVYFELEDPSAFHSPEERLHDLAHELRQPLSSIEAIAYYLEMTLPPGQFEARHYMAQVQRLIAETNSMLDRSVGVTRKGCAKAAGVR